VRLFWNNLADRAALTASSQHPNLLVRNLAHEFLVKVWRTGTTLTEEWVSVDLGEPLPVSSLILAAHTLQPSDQLRYSLSNDAGFIGAEEIPLAWRADTIVEVFPLCEVRYVRIAFTKGMAGEVRQIGRLFLGEHVECDDPDHKGYREQPVDLSKKSRSLGGQSYTEQRKQYREIRIPFDMMPGEQVNEILGIARQVGTHTAFFIQIQDTLADLNRDVLDEVLYVKFKDLSDKEVRGVDVDLLWKLQLDVEEQL